MFIELLKKELKYQFKNIVLYLFLVVVVLFYITQFEPHKLHDTIVPIKKESSYIDYGGVKITDPYKKMENAYMWMNMYYNEGKILKYNILGKYFKSTETEKQVLKQAMDKIAPKGIQDGGKLEIVVTYDEYLEILDELTKQIRGNDVFSEKLRDNLYQRSKTYEEAVDEINDIIKKENITDAFGRLFADYIGVAASMFSIFLSVFALTRDRRNKMDQMIMSKSVSNLTYIGAKYTAVVISIILVILLVATHGTIVLGYIALKNNYAFNFFGLYKYVFGWILPTVMFTTSFGMLISLLFCNGIIAILIYFVIWITSVIPLSGDYRLHKFIIRYNTLGGYNEYISWGNKILVNRIFYIGISLLLFLITAWVWKTKRERY